jgi:hypothetical protein
VSELVLVLEKAELDGLAKGVSEGHARISQLGLTVAPTNESGRGALFLGVMTSIFSNRVEVIRRLVESTSWPSSSLSQ